MSSSFARLSIIVCIAIAMWAPPRIAHATNVWHASAYSQISGTCNARMFTAWDGDPSVPFPRVNDTGLVMVDVEVIGPCVADDFVGVQLAIPPEDWIPTLPALSCGVYDEAGAPIAGGISNCPSLQVPTGGTVPLGSAILRAHQRFVITLPVTFTSAPTQPFVAFASTSFGVGVSQITPTIALAAPALPTMFALDQKVTFSGTSTTGSQGAFTAVANGGGAIVAPFAPTSVDVHFDFAFFYPSGPSSMGVDVALLVDGFVYTTKRLPPSSAGPAQSVDFGSVWLPTGSHSIAVQVRGVLYNGPPTTIEISGSYTKAPALLWRS